MLLLLKSKSIMWCNYLLEAQELYLNVFVGNGSNDTLFTVNMKQMLYELINGQLSGNPKCTIIIIIVITRKVVVEPDGYRMNVGRLLELVSIVHKSLSCDC